MSETFATVKESTLTGIADAIRAKDGSSDAMLPSEMAAKIEAIPSGGCIPAPVWNQPSDWPRIDLVDPGKDTEAYSIYCLVECLEGSLNFGIKVSIGGTVDEVDIASDGSVSVVAGSSRVVGSGEVSFNLDTSKRFRTFRFRGIRQNFELINTAPFSEYALVAIVVKNTGEALYLQYMGAIAVVSGNYIPKVQYIRYVDSTVVLGGNGWRATNSLVCLEFDNVVITGTNAFRNFDTGDNLHNVVFKNGTRIEITGPQGPGLFGSCKFNTIDLSAFDFTGATTFQETVNSWSNVQSLDFNDAIVVKTVNGVEKRCSPTNLNSSFAYLKNCKYLDVSPFDFSRATSATNTLMYNYNLTTLKMPPSSRGIRVSFNLSYSTYLSHESLVGVLNSLGDISGSATQTLTLGATNLAKLTDAEKSIATGKGWTLA